MYSHATPQTLQDPQQTIMALLIAMPNFPIDDALLSDFFGSSTGMEVKKSLVDNGVCQVKDDTLQPTNPTDPCWIGLPTPNFEPVGEFLAQKCSTLHIQWLGQGAKPAQSWLQAQEVNVQHVISQLLPTLPAKTVHHTSSLPILAAHFSSLLRIAERKLDATRAVAQIQDSCSEHPAWCLCLVALSKATAEARDISTSLSHTVLAVALSSRRTGEMALVSSALNMDHTQAAALHMLARHFTLFRHTPDDAKQALLQHDSPPGADECLAMINSSPQEILEKALALAHSNPLVSGDICLSLGELGSHQFHLYQQQHPKSPDSQESKLFDEASRRFAQAKTMFEQAGDVFGQAEATKSLANLKYYKWNALVSPDQAATSPEVEAEYESICELFRDSFTLYKSCDIPVAAANVQRVLGQVELDRAMAWDRVSSSPESKERAESCALRALSSLEEAQSAFVTHGRTHGEACCIRMIGECHVLLSDSPRHPGNIASGRALFLEARSKLGHSTPQGQRLIIRICLRLLELGEKEGLPRDDLRPLLQEAETICTALKPTQRSDMVVLLNSAKSRWQES